MRKKVFCIFIYILLIATVFPAVWSVNDRTITLILPESSSPFSRDEWWEQFSMATMLLLNQYMMMATEEVLDQHTYLKETIVIGRKWRDSWLQMVLQTICLVCLFLRFIEEWSGMFVFLYKSADAAGFDDDRGAIVFDDTFCGNRDFLDDCFIKKISFSPFF